MTFYTTVENAVIQKGTKRDNSGSFYFIEVMAPQRKYINPADVSDAATLDQLASSGRVIPALKLHERNNSLVFSTSDLQLQKQAQ